MPVPNRARLETRDGTLPIDVRGDGGYVIAPGSVHASGAVYLEAGDWREPRAAVPVFWPGWLARPRAAPTRPASRPRPAGDVLARARAYLAAIPRPEIGCGSDNATLYAACRLTRGFGLSPADAESVLWAWAGGRAGWTREWVARKVEHAEKYGSETDWGAAMTPAADAWTVADPTACPVCGRDACEDHLPPAPDTDTPRGLDPAFLADAVDVIHEGQRIAEHGIRYTVDGIIPAYGMLGMLVAYAKVGKTTTGQQIAAAVAMGRPFLDRDTTRARVLAIAAEDPPEYTAYLARTLDVAPTRLTFYRAPVRLTVDGLHAICQTVTAGGYGLVLIASWQAVIRGLVRDENDNAGAVNLVETVKAATRTTGIPWLIDAHSGKGEDQDDEADPSRAMRGASGAAGAADYTLSLRYANGAFGTQRRLSGKGRFVNLAPLTLDYNPDTGIYTCLGSDETRGDRDYVAAHLRDGRPRPDAAQRHRDCPPLGARP